METSNTTIYYFSGTGNSLHMAKCLKEKLDDCELTLKDLHNIAKSFNKILNGIHHHRIEYSDNLTLINGKGKNGSPDRQPTRQVQDTPKENRAKGTGHLKRLGLS